MAINTKKPADDALKAEPVKAAEVKAEEPATEKVSAEVKAEAAEKATAKKPAAKKSAKKSTKTTKTTKASKKEEATEVKAEAAPVATTEIFVEYNGVQVSGEEIVRLVKGSYGKEVTDLKIYVKPEDNRAYYVADGVAGSTRILFL